MILAEMKAMRLTRMTKETRTEGINLSFDGMMWAQALMDSAANKRDQKIARSMYEAFWCLWEILTDDLRKDRPK